MRRRDPARLALAAWTGAVLVFLFAPLLVVALFSFNDSAISRFPIEALTTKWYAALARNASIREALVNSLIVALFTVAIATTLGVMAAIGIHRYTTRLKGTLRTFSLTPMMVPRLIVGIALLTFYNLLQADLSLVTVVFGHVVMTTPYVVLIATARLVGFDRSLEEAARDLGAGTWTVFREITVPFLKPAIIAGALMAFTLSFDEVVVTFFTTGNANTLPMVIWSMLRFGITPEINAIATLTVLLSAALALVAELSIRRAQQAS
jgi:spermidine/putrescine transport system permease protein